MANHPSTEMHGAAHRVVVVGAGFGGLAAARALGGDERISVTIVDQRNYHLFAPLLYQVATAALSPADIAEPVRKILARRRNVAVVLGTVTGVHVDRREVVLADGTTLPYDSLIIATGARYSYFGHDVWASRAPGLKNIEDARRIRSTILTAFEKAENETDPARRQALMTIVIVGGGPTGVELAGAVAELARYTLAHDFRNIRTGETKILLVEAAPRLLGAFSTRIAAYAERRLSKLGVTVLTGQRVEDIREDGVLISGTFTAASTIVWAAGVKASPAAEWLGIATDAQGRIPVRPDLSVSGLAGVYAIGDTAATLGADGKPLPGLAQVAQQQGQHLGKALRADIRDSTPIPPFRFRNRGDAGIVGRHAAFFDFKRWELVGWPAWFLWAIVHVWLLVGFEHRLMVCIQWLWRYLFYESGARLIIQEPSKTRLSGDGNAASRPAGRIDEAAPPQPRDRGAEM